jgi:hypothetical protein
MIHLGLVAFLFSGMGAEGACDPVSSALLDPRRFTFTGLYKNARFGYSVTIPDALEGYDADQATHHGFGIILGDGMHSYLEVEGRENSLENRTAREAADRFIQYMRQDGRTIESTAVERSKLGALEAVQVVVRYVCGGARYVAASTLALSPCKDLEYEITLYAPADRFARDGVVLDQLLKSWTYVGRQ